MTGRVYVPVTSAQLARLVGDRRLAGPLPAHAVTEALRSAWPDGDDEEWEWAALMAAAAESWAARVAGDAPRRHVLAADVDRIESRASEEPTAVVLPDGLAWTSLASAHVDLADDPDPDDDLAWFAPQEVGTLV